jgi:DNA adenine methylase
MTAPARPLLKWAGGKRQLLPVFRRFYPDRLAGYREPFFGSGAVFFDLLRRGALENVPVALTDSNVDLIGCYRMCGRRPGKWSPALARLDRGHAREGEACYYDVREQFNATRRSQPARADGYTPGLAAMLIYLNHTGFNGLFRLNADGAFNVPAGRYVNPRICDPELVHAVGAALGREGVTVRHAGFDQAISDATAGEFVYFDPPYAPLSATSAFGAYTAARFSDQDQRRLRDVVVELARRGCHVMLSNSSASAIDAQYREATGPRVPGLRLSAGTRPPRHQLSRRRPRARARTAPDEPRAARGRRGDRGGDIGKRNGGRRPGGGREGGNWWIFRLQCKSWFARSSRVLRQAGRNASWCPAHRRATARPHSTVVAHSTGARRRPSRQPPAYRSVLPLTHPKTACYPRSSGAGLRKWRNWQTRRT